MAEQWFVVETKLRREKDAAEEITALGFECFAPIEVRRKKDRSKNRRPTVDYEVAMIPRYIFPRFDIRTPCGWQKIARLQSVRGWLKPAADAPPSYIRDESFIDRLVEEQIALRAALNNDQSVKLEHLSPGTRIIIQEGPFASLGGIVNMTVGDRVRIMLDAAGFSALDIARHSVAAA